MLVYLLFNEAGINEQGHQKAQCHKQDYEKDSEPQVIGLLEGLRGCLVLNEAVAFLWLGQQRIADHFKNLWSLEQTIEVFAIDHCLWVKYDVLLVRLIGYPVEHVLLIKRV